MTASQERLDRAVARALDAAEVELLAFGAVAPTLRFEGPFGEAAVRLGPTSGASSEKADALRAAIAADVVVAVFESRIELAAGGGARDVVARGKGADTTRMRVAGVARRKDGRLTLRPFAATIAGAGGADGPMAILGLPDSADIDPADAWRRLERLGVDVGEHGRTLH